MGVIGSACCSEDKPSKQSSAVTPSPRKPPTQTPTQKAPVVNHKHEPISKEQQVKMTKQPPENNFTIGHVQQQKNAPINPVNSSTLKEEQPSKPVDISQVIEKMYPAPKPIKWESFDIIGKLGKGGFGEVYLAELKENKEKGIVEKYAIKRVQKGDIYQKKLTTNIKLEKKIMQQSLNKFITTLHYAFRDREFLYFVMQWAQGGDTYTLIDQSSPRLNDFKKAGQPAVRFILGCLILGMEYLHSKGYMYRDLKPENILIFENGYAKLTDFGLAKEFHENELARTEAGTTIYYAPEMVMRKGYDKSVDIWAIRIYAYEMSNYHPPFASADIKDKLKVKRVIKNAQIRRNWKNPNISDQLKDFINSILKFDPKERLGINGFDEMKNHKFFTCVNFDWEELESMKMESPLKPIIDAKKSKIKPYVPNEKNRRMVNYQGKSQEPECWTYARQKE